MGREHLAARRTGYRIAAADKREIIGSIAVERLHASAASRSRTRTAWSALRDALVTRNPVTSVSLCTLRRLLPNDRPRFIDGAKGLVLAGDVGEVEDADAYALVGRESGSH